MSSEPKPIRLASLDGLRGMAACGVAFLYHPLVEFNLEAARNLPGFLQWFRTWGWTLVDLFFLISGYVFAQVYLGRGNLHRDRLPDFAMARFARLYPLHVVLLLVNLALFGAAPANTWYAFIAHVFMMQAFVTPVGHTFDGPSWSLSVEVLCYAIFAVSAARGDRVLRWVTTASILVGFGYLAIFGGHEGGPWAGDSLPRGLLGFFLGQWIWRSRRNLAKVPVFMFVALLAVGILADMGANWTPLPPLCLLAWPSLLILSLRAPVMGWALFAWLGDRSYSIYLIHYPILLCFMAKLHAEQDAWVSGALVLGYIAIALVVSDLVYRHFEIPARDAIRRAWSRRRMASSSDALTA